MGNYVHFTQEEKDRANNVDLVDFLERQGEKLIRSGRDRRLQSDRSITIRGNEWYDHAKEKGGYSIDFVKNFYSLSFPEAVNLLLGDQQGEVYSVAPKKLQVSPKPFQLPPRNSNMRRVYAYLNKTRGIQHEVINFFAKEKLIYESCENTEDGHREYHNAVFVGMDENGTPSHAHKRGLYTNGIGFKGNVESSDPYYSFHYKGISNRLYVFEAPIDMLSFLSMHEDGWKEHSFVSLCGVSEHAMLKMLELDPNIDHVTLCLDNDKAGMEASKRLAGKLKEKEYFCGYLHSQGKDWNEDLMNNKSEIRTVLQEQVQAMV